MKEFILSVVCCSIGMAIAEMIAYRIRKHDGLDRIWKTCTLVDDGDSWHCSNCGSAASKQSWAYWRYCPKCGAFVW